MKRLKLNKLLIEINLDDKNDSKFVEVKFPKKLK